MNKILFSFLQIDNEESSEINKFFKAVSNYWSQTILDD